MAITGLPCCPGASRRLQLAGWLTKQLTPWAPCAPQEMEEGICKPPHLEPGERKPTACVVRAGGACAAAGCARVHLLVRVADSRTPLPSTVPPRPRQGHNVTLSFQGGHCDLLHPPQHGVVCHPPRVVLVKTPAACTLKHTTPLRVVGKECKVVKEWGEAKQGYLLPPVTKSASLSLGDALATLQQRAGGAAASSAGSGPIGEGGLIGEGGRLRGRVASVLSALSALGQRLHRG